MIFKLNERKYIIPDAFSFEKSWFSTIKMCGDNRFSQKLKDNRA